MGRRASPRTDFGTVILHWTLVGLLTISVVTGLRIATASPLDLGWLHALDHLLPKTIVWTAHMPAAVGLLGLALAYLVYVRRAGIARRIRPDRVRLMGLFGHGQARWSTVNTIINWILFATLLSQLVTGSLMYLGYGGAAVTLHRLGMWLLLALALAHVAVHWAIGGMGQLARMFRPSRLPPPAPAFDALDLMTERSSADRLPPRPVHAREPSRRERRVDPRPRPQREVRLQAHPLAVAMAVGLAGIATVTVLDRAAMRDTLYIGKIATADAPALDGDLSDPVWRSARRVVVATNQGANFDGTGTSAVEIRAVHDGETVYFAFVWDDPTRSLKHLPLIKKADGWYVLQGEYDVGDEHAYHEDKLAVLLTRDDALLAGDRTFHAGRAPIDSKPATFSGRGLHYTTDGSIVDVWQWKASRGGLLGRIDDSHFGPPAEPSTDEVEGRSPYKGGFAADDGIAGYAENFEQRAPGGYRRPVRPKRLPKDWHATWSAMGRVDLDPNVGESDGARWWMTEAESLPYTAELDTQFPVGALIPGVIIFEEHTGDRADIRCSARWAAGRWALEVARRLDTGSSFDVPIASGIFMRVAAFDHSQIRHTRHIRPIRLEVQ
jgi:hypothetical protein